MATHIVQRGENLTLIARKYGIPHWQTIYHHPNNLEFRRKRPNPNIILPGDQLFIPDQRPVGGPTPPQQAPTPLPPVPVNAIQFLARAPYPANLVYPELDHPQRSLGAKKQAWWDTAIAAGANQSEAAIIVAQVMQEGTRDATKDNAGGAANYSDLNLNRSLLTQFGGVAQQNLAALNANTPSARQNAVRAALTAMRSMGVERYLHHVRGGTTGYNNPNQRISHNPSVTNDDTSRFGRNIANAAKKLLDEYARNPRSMSSDQRYAGNIPWI